MRIVQPLAPRHNFEDEGTLLKISIPSRKNWLIISFFAAWLIGWAFGEITTGAILLKGVLALFSRFNPLPAESGSTPEGVDLFLIVWFIGWTLGGGFALYAFFWQVAGREVVEVSHNSVLLRREIFSLGRSMEYLAEHVKDLRVSPYDPKTSKWGRNMDYGLAGGFLAFDYGAKTIHFGAGVDEAEAKQILQTIQLRYPLYKTEAPR
jgi:hypothetical protein